MLLMNVPSAKCEIDVGIMVQSLPARSFSQERMKASLLAALSSQQRDRGHSCRDMSAMQSVTAGVAATSCRSTPCRPLTTGGSEGWVHVEVRPVVALLRRFYWDVDDPMVAYSILGVVLQEES